MSDAPTTLYDPLKYFTQVAQTASASPEALLHAVAPVASDGASKAQAKALLLLLRYRPNETVASSLLASSQSKGMASLLATVHELRLLADDGSISDVFVESPSYLSAALAGNAPSKDVSADLAGSVLGTLRDAPNVFRAVAVNPSVAAWAQHARSLAGETGFDSALGLPPPAPDTVEAAKNFSSSQAQELLNYWRQYPAEAQRFIASHGTVRSFVIFTALKKASGALPSGLPGMPVDPLDAVFSSVKGPITSGWEDYALGAGAACAVGILAFAAWKSRGGVESGGLHEVTELTAVGAAAPRIGGHQAVIMIVHGKERLGVVSEIGGRKYGTYWREESGTWSDVDLRPGRVLRLASAIDPRLPAARAAAILAEWGDSGEQLW